MVLETNDLWDENDPWARFLMNALKAKEFYRRDVQYIVRNGKALIINELTGRVEEKRRWSVGIHQAVEAKEGLQIQYAVREAETIAQAGWKYAITISTNMAGRGTDIILGVNPKMLAKKILEDRLLPFMTEEAPNVEIDGEQISQKGLSKIKIGPSSIALLAKASCIAKYGRKSKEDWPYQKAKLLIQESIEKVLQDCETHCVNEGAEEKGWGGLHVIGTSLHESRRIDNQLRGRAGRQGDPGSTSSCLV